MLGSRDADRPLVAVYDLSVCPVNYDFVHFLILSEIERTRLGLSHVHIVIVPGETDGFFWGMPYDTENKWWRLQNIVMPACSLLPSCKQTTLCANREEAAATIEKAEHTFPKNYDLSKPVGYYMVCEVVAAWAIHGHDFPLAAPAQARSYIQSWIDSFANGKHVVTITLRQATYQEMRNSDVNAWADFARWLEKMGYFPVIIPDTEAIFKPPHKALDGLTVFNEAAVNLLLRAALYELSYLNMYVGSGPTSICRFSSRTRYQHFRITSPGSLDTRPEIIEGVWGVDYGSQFPFAGEYQKLIWEPESFDLLKDEFLKIEGVIDGRIDSSQYRPVVVPKPESIAEKFYKAGRFVQARDIYEHLLSLGQGDDNLKSKLGHIYVEIGNPEKALPILDTISPDSPESLEASIHRADAHLKMNQIEKAVGLFREAAAKAAAENSVLYVSAVIKLAWALESIDRLGEAIDVLHQSLHRLPDELLLYRALGDLLESHELSDPAKKCFTAELRLSEKKGSLMDEDPKLKIRIGALHNKLGEYQKTASSLTELLAVQPGEWTAYEHLADAFAGLGRFDEAIQSYENGIKMSWGRDAQLHYKLALALKKTGRLDAAAERTEQCLKLTHSNYSRVYELLASLYHDLGRQIDASKMISELNKIRITQDLGSEFP